MKIYFAAYEGGACYVKQTGRAHFGSQEEVLFKFFSFLRSFFLGEPLF